MHYLHPLLQTSMELAFCVDFVLALPAGLICPTSVLQCSGITLGTGL